jgi:hypothetical protein
MSNYDWLVRHGLALAREYTFRYNKIHKSTEVIEWAWQNKPNILDLGLLPFAQAMPNQYKDPDAVVAYRNYYMKEKARLATWKFCDTPHWYEVTI